MLIDASVGGIVEAEGGLVTIDVPPGALSDDIEITVSKVENDASEPGDMPELAAYEFGPDGTIFSSPVKISLVLPISLLEPGFQLIHRENAISSENSHAVEIALDIEDFVISADGETATVITAISSFSRITVYRQSKFQVELTIPDEATAGVPFNARAVTTRTAAEGDVFRRHVAREGELFGLSGELTVHTTTVGYSEEWTLSGRFGGDANTSPYKVPSAPPKTALTTPTFTANSTFTCNSPGNTFGLVYISSIDVGEIWNVTLGPSGSGVPGGVERPTKITAWEFATGNCVAPEVTPSPTSVSALPTSTPDALSQASEVFLTDPTESPTTQSTGDGSSSASVQLPNGMTVQVEITPWGGNVTLKKSWSGSVDFLQYILDMTISGEAEDGKRQQVEYQVSAVEPRGLIDWTDVIQKIAGADAGVLEERVVLPWAGEYVVKGSVGGEAFELTAAAIEPELRFGLLVEPGTWSGRTPLSDESASDLADFSGEWSGWIDAAWLDEIETYSVHVLTNDSEVSLERVDLVIEPLMTGVLQGTPDGRRIPYEMIVPRAEYEGSFSYNLPAYSYEDGHCGSETLTYDISGTVEYRPNRGPWAAPLVLNGNLSGPLPKLAREIPRTVQIEVVAPDLINRQVLREEGSSLPIIGPLDEGAHLGFIVGFSDMEVNSASTINDESTCESYVGSIALVAVKN